MLARSGSWPARCLLFQSVPGLSLPSDMGQAKTKVGFKQLFSKSREINILSAARFFLFGARDIWFVVGVPIFLEGTLDGVSPRVGAFMALWVIGYGIVQSMAPAMMRGAIPNGGTATWTAFVLAGVAAAVPLALSMGVPAQTVIIGGLGAVRHRFRHQLGRPFLPDSRLHRWGQGGAQRWLLLHGQCGGRPLGCLLSGVLFQLSGLPGCLWGTFAFALAAALIALRLPRRPFIPNALPMPPSKWATATED